MMNTEEYKIFYSCTINNINIMMNTGEYQQFYLLYIIDIKLLYLLYLSFILCMFYKK